jgi:protein-L-isoaspartate(D-aspartate) O-methyltransferase
VSNPKLTGIGMTSARTRDRLIARLREQGIADPRVLERIRSVPRHVFMDEALASRAYEDTALPIGHGQTISQPYIVARMTEALLEGGVPRKVLEIGTGCGYQTAVLAPLVTTVYSVERIAALQLRARQVLRERKSEEAYQEWLRQLRDQTYVELRLENR